MKENIKKVIEEILELGEGTLRDDTMIKDIPVWDSLMFIMILSELQEQFGISVPLEDALKIEYVSDIFKYI